MQWFKHDANANMDAKLQEVLLDYGLEGYGLYWYCIELIAGKIDKNNITFALEHDARIIARNTGCSVQKTQEIMKKFIELGLFESSDGIVTCMKLARRLDQSMTSNSEMRALISGIKNHDAIMTASSESVTESCKNRIDKNRKDKENKKPTGKPLVNFSRWIELVRDAGEKPIPIDSPIFEYAQDAGIDPDYLRLAWVEFKARYTDDTKRYKDWRAVFSKSVRGNWFKLWWHDGEGYKLTTLGQQNMAAMKTRDKREGL